MRINLLLLLKRCYWRRRQLSQPQCLHQSFTEAEDSSRLLHSNGEKRCSRHCVDSRWWILYRGASTCDFIRFIPDTFIMRD